MSEETKQKIKNKCLEKDITLTSFYCRPSKEDAENGQTEKLFQFCKEWHISLTTDPVRIAEGPGSMAKVWRLYVSDQSPQSTWFALLEPRRCIGRL